MNSYKICQTTARKETTENRRRRENNIKMNLKTVGEDVN
jgi:hypothetical protein